MGDPKGFLSFKREKAVYRPICERVKDYKEVFKLRPEKKTEEQAARCMDCGTPFCHWACPIGNYIPEWNDLLFHKHWDKAYQSLAATNNFPEITGRICPALCEYSCVLGINDDPVTIRENELAIIEHAFGAGWVKPRTIKYRTGKRIAVIGSGPSGLACADQLNTAGHTVEVFEEAPKPGGILRYGIPDFKLDKAVIDRRIKILQKEGIKFTVNTEVGSKYPVNKLMNNFDAVCMTGGSREPRDLKIQGRDLKGIYFAMEYLEQANIRNEGVTFKLEELIDAKDKKVVVIGGGDTGSDCVGTANRQGSKCVTQIELMPKPAECRTMDYPWPKYPLILKTSTSHEEGGSRDWAIITKRFLGKDGVLKKLICARAEFSKDPKTSCPVMKELENSEFIIEADLVFLAMGFLHPKKDGIITKLKLEFDQRGNVKADDKFMTNHKGVFVAGDMRRGQSLVVWAISEGRKAAHYIDEFLMGHSNLPLI